MTMITKDFKQILADRGSVLVLALLVICVAAAVLLGRPAEGTPKLNLGIVDKDSSEYSKLLISYFAENEVFNEYITVVCGSEYDIESEFNAGELDLYVVIPEEFAANLMRINNVGMKAVINSSDITKSVILKELLNSYADYISAVEVNCQSVYDIMTDSDDTYENVQKTNERISYDLIFTALGKDSFFEIVDYDRVSGIPLSNYYVYVLIAVIVLYTGVFAGASLLKDRLSMTYTRLSSIGYSRIKMILSKCFAYGTFLAVMLIAAFLTVHFASDVKLDTGAFIAAMIFGYLCCLLWCLTALLFKSSSSYMVLSNMIVLFMCIAGGGIIPIMYLPEVMANIAKFTPIYWFIRMLV